MYKVDLLLFLLCPCFLLSLLLLGSLVLMMTKVKEQSQKGQRSQGHHRPVHRMLQLLPYQPLDLSVRPSLVSSHRQFSICEFVYKRKGLTTLSADFIQDVGFLKKLTSYPWWGLQSIQLATAGRYFYHNPHEKNRYTSYRYTYISGSVSGGTETLACIHELSIFWRHKQLEPS